MKGDEASNVERSFLSALALVPAAFAPLQLQQDQLRKGPNGKVDFSPQKSVKATAVEAKESTPLTRTKKKFMNCCKGEFNSVPSYGFGIGVNGKGEGKRKHCTFGEEVWVSCFLEREQKS